MKWLLAFVLVGCGSSDAASVDAGPQTATTDASKLGPECGDASSCPNGESCNRFPGFEAPRCGPADACTIVTCPTGATCVIGASIPGAVGCQQM